MSDDPGILAMIGVRIQPFFAGVAGGAVGALADSKSGLLAWMSYVGAGGLTANFLADPALHVIPVSFLSEGGAGFIIGLGALAIVRTIIGVIRKWNPAFGTNNGGPHDVR
jgi:hypothetical protein